ncbi:MAG: hypothetical protein IKZ90_05700 [Clostridiales bacterium]|nr:hypothetical protein [Clostridiales bacterium]
MIHLLDSDMQDFNRQSSKGNQLKFRKGDIWYKADYLGYEGLAEYVVSKLLAFSDLRSDEYVEYELEEIEYNDSAFRACKSKDFTDGWNLITLERLFKDTYGVGLNKIIYSTPDHVERLKILVEQVERTTGIKDFGIYMSKLLTVDALFLNEDRHTHNIAVLTNGTGDFRLAPIFDNGAGLLSDTSMEYPLTRDPLEWIPKVKPKTFCDSFQEQMEIAEKLYGENLHFSFGYNEVETVVEKTAIYPEEIRRRVIDVVMEMKRRYSYLFICE